MNQWPLRFREVSGAVTFADDSGTFFRSDRTFLHRYAIGALSAADEHFLDQNGHTFSSKDDPAFWGFANRWARRFHLPQELSYVILVPTLRCDLDCSYCQVSRVGKGAKGFDWDEPTADAVLRWLGTIDSKTIKIEFQGGEPLLRLDLLERVREFCRKKFSSAEFVVCTNLQNVSAEAWSFLAAEDTHVSTSFDGTIGTHQRQRTKSTEQTIQFEKNLRHAISKLGVSRVSALPTIDPNLPPCPKELIEAFAELGFRSIFLRKVNFQGFARKRFDFEHSLSVWLTYYREFVAKLIEFNSSESEPLEEYYLSLLLRRIFQAGHNEHVDLRNPNWLGTDYLVVDFDGRFYPTDEARMMTRVGQVDLSIGDVSGGLDCAKIAILNSAASNFDDPECRHCVYQPYCGVDRIDELSRHGRIDLPRHLTEHCNLHTGLFDLAFELIYSDVPEVQKSVAAWIGVPAFSMRLAPTHL